MGNTTGSGTINVTETFNFTGGTVTELRSGVAHLIHFDGTANQSITCSGTVNNLINFSFNNTAGYTLTGNVPINTNANLNHDPRSICRNHYLQCSRNQFDLQWDKFNNYIQ